MRLRLLVALALLLTVGSPALAADVFSTDASTPRRATVNGTPIFPRIFYDSGESSNFADISVTNLNLGRFGMTHYLNYQFGTPYQKATSQLTPLAPLGMWGIATGNACCGNSVEAMSAGNGNFVVVDNTPSPTTPFRQLFPTLAGAGGVYLADEVSASQLSNILQWRTTYHADMPTMPAFVVLLPEGPLATETVAGSGVEQQFGSSVGFTEHLLSVANPYWWMRNLPSGGNDWIGEDPYPIFRPESTPGASGGVLEQGGYPHYWVADRAAHTVAAATQNGKVPVLTLQLFTGLFGARFPTPNEQWQHTIMAVTEGIRGLAWWQIGNAGGLRQQTEPTRTNAENALINITQFLKANETAILSTPVTSRVTNSTSTGNALQWRKTALVAATAGIVQTNNGDGGGGSYRAELNALNAGVTQWSPMLDQSGDVRHRVFRVGGSLNYLVFAYNYAPTARNNVTFNFESPVSSVTVVDEARTITPSGSTWTDNFGGSSSLTQGASRNAHIYQVALVPSTNCFTWGFEANTGAGGPKGPGGNTVQFNGMYGNSTITTAQAHSGTHALQVPFATTGGFPVLSNDSNGVDLEQIVVPAGHPCEIASVGGAGLYSRAWLKIPVGFNWNGSVHSTSKVIRWFNAMTMFLGSGGMYVAECDGQQPASGGGVCKNATGHQNSIDGCSGNEADGSICAKLPGVGLNAYSDGLWHEHIIFLKPNSAPGTSTNPGANPTQFDAVVKYWIDGVQKAAYTGWHLHDTNNAPWGLGQQFGVFWYNQVGPSNPGPIFADDVSIDTAFNSTLSGTPDTTPPSAPTSVQATVISAAQINLSWLVCADTDNGGGQAGISRTYIEHCTGAACSNFTPLTNVAGAQTTFTDSPLAPSTLYRYRLYCVDNSGNGASAPAYSSIVQGTTLAGGSTAPEAFCPGGASPDSRVRFCDNNEDGVALASKYYDYCSQGIAGCNDTGTFLKSAGNGLSGSTSMRSHFVSGQTTAGHVIISFGRTGAVGTNSCMFDCATDYRDLYFRWFERMASNWTPPAGGFQDGGLKNTRATIFTDSSWNQAMISHAWAGDTNTLEMDPVNFIGPVTGTCPNCTPTSLTATNIRAVNGYNDFANMAFLGRSSGPTQLFSTAQKDQWRCIEHHVRLNDAGVANGINEFWIDNNLETRQAGLNFVAGYQGFGLNAYILENFINAGAPAAMDRDFDNVVVATTRIGCTIDALSGAAPPPVLSVAPASLAYTATVGAGNPASQAVTIGSGGATQMTWTLAGTMPGFTCSPTSGTTATQVTCTENISGLTAGSYSGTLTVTAPGVTNSPQSVSTTLSLSPATAPQSGRSGRVR